jgi:hypothetical protein
MTVRDTGGVADTLGGALSGETGNAQADVIAASGLLKAIDLAEGPKAIADAIAQGLHPEPGAGSMH